MVNLKRFLITFVIFLFTVTVFAAELYPDYFRLPLSIENSMERHEDVDLFFDSTENDLNLPGAGLSSNIFYRLNRESDPLEGANRFIFNMNGYLIDYVLQPISWTFSAVIPKYGREGISRMDVNINMPNRLINSMLQAKFEKTGTVLLRFVINTTIGVAGFYDVAYSWWELEPYNTNFGSTFKYWGIGHGFYLVIPVEGSTSLRDSIGMIGDYFANPLTYIPPYTLLNPISWGIKAGLGINKMTLNIDSFQKVYKSNYDPYDLTKHIWFFMERQNGSINSIQ
ncbi:MAG: VacJ family lipoprotein [Victivallales bacterium]|nr:VacJ family lipoprotein [Victivallales bacterium]